jgi:membrane protein YqaA with SNARE-associated domain
MDLQDIFNWMQQLAITYGYLGIFIIALIGAASIIFPLPYTVIIFIIAGSTTLEPILIAVAAGFGATIGEFTSYLLGMGGRRALATRYKTKIDVLQRTFQRYGSIVIFLFALTPLPDDLLFIPLGIMRYKIAKAFIPALIGKFLMNLIVAYSGRYSVAIFKQIFGVESDLATALTATILAVVLLAIVMVIMLKLDWERILDKHLAQKQQEETAR